MAKQGTLTYVPPFTVSAEAINLIAEISAQIERYAIRLEQEDGLRLRKANRIKTIHSSLAIEGNTLSEDEVRDIVDGKTVVAPIRQIQEVKNAIATYNLYPTLDAFKEKDLLKAHGLMMSQLERNAGHYRQEGVGVFDGNGNCLHMAPPPDRVPELMGDLFHWVKICKTHPLVYSCVFHYEFEFIHPFIDGNGRMGRYWQTMLLSRWKGIFSWIPVETIVKEHQQEYYGVISKCDVSGESTLFIEFMLQCLLEVMENYEESEGEETKVQDKVQDKMQDKIPELSQSAWEVLEILHQRPKATVNDICSQLDLKDRQVYKHIATLKSIGLLVRVGSNKTGYWKVNVEL